MAARRSSPPTPPPPPTGKKGLAKGSQTAFRRAKRGLGGREKAGAGSGMAHTTTTTALCGERGSQMCSSSSTTAAGTATTAKAAAGGQDEREDRARVCGVVPLRVDNKGLLYRVGLA